jgi:hypothetical protein
MKTGEKKEFLFLDSVGFIDAGDNFLFNLKVAAESYKRENEQMKDFLEKEYPDKEIVKKGLNWHVNERD